MSTSDFWSEPIDIRIPQMYIIDYHKYTLKACEREELLQANEIIEKPLYNKKLSRIPAATALPITPETFGAIACISR